MAQPEEIKVLVRNRRARHEYFVEETIEAGIELRGSEVKSLRASAASIAEAYACIRDGQAYLVGMQINEYAQASYLNHEPRRERRLLLHRKEIDRLDRRVREKGYTLIPVEVYLKRGRVKVAIGLCRGKQQHDKREAVRARDEQRDLEAGRRR